MAPLAAGRVVALTGQAPEPGVVVRPALVGHAERLVDVEARDHGVAERETGGGDALGGATLAHVPADNFIGDVGDHGGLHDHGHGEELRRFGFQRAGVVTAIGLRGVLDGQGPGGGL